ncbi:CCA tRNA nucleotidyltransferase [Candidatus Micrarchaeota archaeon]|nr:CCA tRNA nucleotidyltransferase [Candidatus Micrarchaeota archaeon]
MAKKRISVPFVLRAVLPYFLPDAQELATESVFANYLLGCIERVKPMGARIVLTGSVAKRTFLKNNREVDVFVLFNPEFPKSQFESLMVSIAKSAFPDSTHQLSYAEHPYVRLKVQGHKVDLVPAYDIKDVSGRKSAVDRSVFHTKFVLSKINDKMRQEIVLLKAFLKSNSLYGAEIKFQGFSGYLCELLIIKYGTFAKLLRAASKWKDGVLIDLMNYYRTSSDKGLCVHRFGFFVVIDPTDENRNVAAAVSKSNFDRFRTLASSFLKNPHERFFLSHPPTFEEQISEFYSSKKVSSKSSSKNPLVYLVSLVRPNVVDDVLWGQLRKLISQLEESLSDFGILSVFADDGKHLVRIAIILKKDLLSPSVEIPGPPTSMKEHIVKFRVSHKDGKFSIKKGRLFVKKKRLKRKVMEYLWDFFQNYSRTSKAHLAYPPEMLVIENVTKDFRKMRG